MDTIALSQAADIGAPALILVSQSHQVSMLLVDWMSLKMGSRRKTTEDVNEPELLGKI